MNNQFQRTISFGRGESFEQVSFTTGAAVSLSPPAGSISALVSVDGASARFRVDGTNPTTTVGHLMANGQFIELFGDDMKYARFIGASGSGTVNVTYFF